jgi:hypothetical protein
MAGITTRDQEMLGHIERLFATTGKPPRHVELAHLMDVTITTVMRRREKLLRLLPNLPGLAWTTRCWYCRHYNTPVGQQFCSEACETANRKQWARERQAQAARIAKRDRLSAEKRRIERLRAYGLKHLLTPDEARKYGGLF